MVSLFLRIVLSVISDLLSYYLFLLMVLSLILPIVLSLIFTYYTSLISDLLCNHLFHRKPTIIMLARFFRVQLTRRQVSYCLYWLGPDLPDGDQLPRSNLHLSDFRLNYPTNSAPHFSTASKQQNDSNDCGFQLVLIVLIKDNLIIKSNGYIINEMTLKWHM